MCAASVQPSLATMGAIEHERQSQQREEYVHAARYWQRLGTKYGIEAPAHRTAVPLEQRGSARFPPNDVLLLRVLLELLNAACGACEASAAHQHRALDALDALAGPVDRVARCELRLHANRAEQVSTGCAMDDTRRREKEELHSLHTKCLFAQVLLAPEPPDAHLRPNAHPSSCLPHATRRRRATMRQEVGEARDKHAT